MPLKYDPVTGIPSFEIEAALELNEGETPTPDVITYAGKAGIFAGDGPRKGKVRVPKPSEDEHEGVVALGSDAPGDPHKGITIDAYAIPPEEMGKAIDDAVGKITKSVALDNTMASDEEIADLEQQVHHKTIDNWPMLLRVLNRLRLAERR